MEGAIQIGERLQEAKEQVGHGNFETWCEENLNYSSRTARNFMRIASEYGGENGLISNRKMSSDLSISNALSLLKVPEEDREQFIEEHQVEDMTNKELEEEIRKLKEEKATLEEEVWNVAKDRSEIDGKLSETEAEVQRLKSKLAVAEKEAEETPDTSELEAEKEDLQEKLKQAKADLKDYKKQVKDQIAVAKMNAEQEAQKKAETDLEKKIAEQAEQIRKEEADKRAGLEKEIEKLNKMADPAVVEFKIRADALQEDFAACRKAIAQAEPERQEKMKAALKVVLQKMEERL